MSLKPSKKSDANKAWMKKRRDKEIPIQPERHLIVTEGTKTEPLYFQSIRDIVNQKYQHRIQLDIFGEGANTLDLFEKAKRRALQNPNGYKHVWIVFDTDDFPPDRINKTVELCEDNSTESMQFHAVWSNQCIELWYLLHFSFLHSDLHRQEYWPKLTKALSEIGAGAYQKGRADMYQVLKPYMETGIANARKLNQINKEKTPVNSKPGTKVYELIEILKPYLDD